MGVIVIDRFVGPGIRPIITAPDRDVRTPATEASEAGEAWINWEEHGREGVETVDREALDSG